MRHQHVGVLRYTHPGSRSYFGLTDRGRKRVKSELGQGLSSRGHTHVTSRGPYGVLRRRSWVSSRTDTSSGAGDLYDYDGTRFTREAV